MSEEHGNGVCCGACKGDGRPKSRFVVGVFTDTDGAKGVAERLRLRDAGDVSVLSNANPLAAHSPCGAIALSLLSCGRLHEQIVRHLASGATIVVVDAQSPEHRLGASKMLLESKCDLLLTHDGADHARADRR